MQHPLPAHAPDTIVAGSSTPSTRAVRHTDLTRFGPSLFQDVAVIIPALDEEGSLPGVLAALPPQVQVIVVDNGSRDRTAEVARARGATVLSCATRGYGSAVSAGLTYLSTQPPQIVAILDADHADRPELLHRLLVPIREGRADLVLADRTRTADVGSLTLVQRLGNTFAVALMRQTRGVQHRDMGPFRALRWSIVPALGMVDPTWGWNVEMALKTHNRGFRSLEVPMPYRRRKLGQSKISGTLSGAARAGARILIAVARYHRA